MHAQLKLFKLFKLFIVIFQNLFALTFFVFLIHADVYAAISQNVQNSNWEEIQQYFLIDKPATYIQPPHRRTIKSLNTLTYLKEHIDKNHMMHIRMQQMYAGFPVFGGYMILHKPIIDNAKPRMNGLLYQDLKKDLGNNPPPQFSKNAYKALATIEASYQDNRCIAEEEIEPIVYIDTKQQAHWAYQLSFMIHHPQGFIEKPALIIDAISYKPYLQWDNLKTITAVKGFGFGGNQKTGMHSYDGINRPFLEMTQTRASSKNPATCYMENKDAKVIHLDHTYTYRTTAMKYHCKPVTGLENTVWTGYEGNGYDQENGNYSITNDALYAAYIIKHMYRDWYQLEVLKNADGTPKQIVMDVHYGKNYEAARWYKNLIMIGDGGNLTYPPVSIDILAHELSHGFTEQNAKLIHYGHSGAMDEAFSDMAAQVAQYFAYGKNDWMIGAEIMKEESGYTALRYMDVPSKDGHSLDNAKQYPGDFIDTHHACGVFNRLFYLIATQKEKGWDLRKAFAVMLKANMDYWTPLSTFQEGACGILNAAKDLGYEQDGIKAALNEVLIDYKSCSRVILY